MVHMLCMYAFVARKEGKVLEICAKKRLLSKIEGFRPESLVFHPPLSRYATATTLVEPGPSRVDACLSKRSLCFGGSALLGVQVIVG